MNLRSLFTKKQTSAVPSERRGEEARSHERLDLDLLDACVGGRSETDGVGCYAHSSQPRVH
jgi:hypothetical protein